LYKAVGISLGLLVPLGLAWGGMMLLIFRRQHRHEERMQQARLREAQARASRYRVIQGGQG
jgi:preprotein translocase subunit YajC